jgi:integrase
MSLRKFGRYYWLDMRIHGRRIRRSPKTGEHALDIERAREIQDELLKGAESKDITIHEFSMKYLDRGWSSKPASADREAQRMKKILDFFDSIDISYLSDVTPYHLEQLRTWLKERKDEPVKEGAPKKPDRSKTTLNRYMQLLRGMFYRAIDWELYQKPNPLKKVKFYREEGKVRPLSRADVEKVLEAAEKISKKPQSPLQKIFRDLVLFGLNTGLRKSEILNLRWKDVKEDEVEVRGKGDRRRTVPLNQAAQAVIRWQPRRTEFVFDIPNRKQPDLFRRTIIQIRKATGVDFHFHLLRHFFTTALLEKGVDFVTIGSLLGHSKVTTSLIYSHTDRERKRKALDLLEG